MHILFEDQSLYTTIALGPILSIPAYEPNLVQSDVYLTGNLKSSNESLIPVRNFGSMTTSDIEAGFGGPVNNIFYIEKLASVAASGGDAAYLRYLLDDWGINITISVPFTAQQNEVWAAYDWMFEPGYQFNGTSNNGGKMPGFFGGDGVNASGGNNATTGFSSRFMWRTNGRAVGYLYHPDKPGTFGEDVQFVQNWGVNSADYFWPVGSWFRVVVRKVMNTDGGTYNGELHVWVDELGGAGPVKRYERTGMRWRTTTAYTVDRFVLVTFYGGDDATWYPGTPQYARSKKLEVGTNQLWST